MFDDYKKNVILAYQKKRDTSVISINLSQPSPAKLRLECLIVYKERPLAKDENTLRAFFGSGDNLRDYGQNINKLEIDKYRPLINFLKGRTTEPDERIVELLAWLIDFEPRPYKSGNNYKADVIEEITLENSNNPSKSEDEGKSDSDVIKTDKEASIEKVEVIEVYEAQDGILCEKIEDTGEVKTVTTMVAEPVIRRNDKWKKVLLKLKNRKAIVSFITIIVAGSITYEVLIDRKECMYWTGDHYQCIACTQKVGDTSIIALDTTKVAHLKRITHPDTLTRSSLGKIWYSKINGSLEFYTSNGFHPIYNDRRLRPVTMYILNKYVLQKTDTIKSPIAL